MSVFEDPFWLVACKWLKHGACPGCNACLSFSGCIWSMVGVMIADVLLGLEPQ